MKILFSHFGIKKQGGWGRTYMLAKGVADLGNHVTILTSYKTVFIWKINLQRTHNLTIVSIPYIFGKSFISKGFGIYNLLLRVLYSLFHKFDIVHADAGHRPNSGFPCKINRLFWGSVYFTEWWDHFGKEGQFKKKSRIFKLLLGRYELWSEVNDKITADGIIVLSEFMKTRALNLGISEKKILKLHGGANIEYIKYIEDSSLIKIKNNLPVDYLTFGFIGMTKGDLNDLLPFITAINNLKNELKVNWITAGQKIPDDKKENLEISKELYELGWVDYFTNSEILSCVDVFVLLKENNITNNAGWPNKFGDYLAYGRPILVNEYGEISAFAKNFNAGLFVVSRDSNEIEKKIRFIYSIKDKLNIMGAYNRKIAEEQYSWFNMSKILVTFYQKIKE